jgi:hypothetical protein
MKVIVAILPEARQDLLTLLEPRATITTDTIGFGRIYLEDLEQQFVKYNGYPPGARRTQTSDGSEWWWRYVDGVWVVYRIAEARRWFGGLVRNVTIVGFEAAPPAA